MRQLFKPCIWIMMLVIILTASCKKNDSVQLQGSLIAKDFVYNLATKNFYPDTSLTAQVTSPGGLKFVYCYLLRSNTADSLIFVGYPSGGTSTDYSFSIPATSFPYNTVKNVRGIKVMVKQADNSSFENLIKIDVYDPSKPFLTDFPVTVSADLNGGTTAITGTVTSESGIARVDIYDDYQTTGTYTLVHSLTDPNGAKSYALNYPYIYRKAAQHIKVAATDIYGQTMETVIDMPVDMSNFKPKFVDFPASVTPDPAGTPVNITGRITTLTGLAKIDIYDDYAGDYQLIQTLPELNGTRDYAFSYPYSYRKRAQNLKIIATDTDNLPTELVIPLNVTYSTNIYKDVVLSAQGTSSQSSENSAFVAATGTIIGNCQLNANESNIDFILYASSGSGTVSFYSPSNISTSTASAFKCGGTGWTPTLSNFKDNRIRVLSATANMGEVIKNINKAIDNNEIDVLDDNFFTSQGFSVPTGKTASSANYGTSTSNNLIWIRIPLADGSFKNCLIRVKELNIASTIGLSTVKVDVVAQK